MRKKYTRTLIGSILLSAIMMVCIYLILTPLLPKQNTGAVGPTQVPTEVPNRVPVDDGNGNGKPITDRDGIGDTSISHTEVQGASDQPLQTHAWTLTDADATRLACKLQPGVVIQFMSENRVRFYHEMSTLWPVILTIGISDGKLTIENIPLLVFHYLEPYIGSYASYSENKIILTNLPSWFDTTVEIAPAVTELPYIESITTEEGKVIITYYWP